MGLSFPHSSHGSDKLHFFPKELDSQVLWKPHLIWSHQEKGSRLNFPIPCRTRVSPPSAVNSGSCDTPCTSPWVFGDRHPCLKPHPELRWAAAPAARVTFAELIHSFSPSLKKKTHPNWFQQPIHHRFSDTEHRFIAENCDKMSQHDKNNPKAAEASCRPPGWSPEGSDCCGFAGSQASEVPWQSQIHRPHPAQHPAAGMERATCAALPRPTAGEALGTTKKLSCRV